MEVNTMNRDLPQTFEYKSVHIPFLHEHLHRQQPKNIQSHRGAYLMKKEAADEGEGEVDVLVTAAGGPC